MQSGSQQTTGRLCCTQSGRMLAGFGAVASVTTTSGHVARASSRRSQKKEGFFKSGRVYFPVQLSIDFRAQINRGLLFLQFFWNKWSILTCKRLLNLCQEEKGPWKPRAKRMSFEFRLLQVFWGEFSSSFFFQMHVCLLSWVKNWHYHALPTVV